MNAERLHKFSRAPEQRFLCREHSFAISADAAVEVKEEASLKVMELVRVLMHPPPRQQTNIEYVNLIIKVHFDVIVHFALA